MPQPYSLEALERLEREGTLFAENPPDGPYPDATLSMWHAGLQKWMTEEQWILHSEPLAIGTVSYFETDDDDGPPDFVTPKPAVVHKPEVKRRGKKKDDRTQQMFDVSNDAMQL